MITFEPLLTHHVATGAIRPVTAGLLREVYLAPRDTGWTQELIAGFGNAPWARSLAVAPGETASAIEMALRALISSTATLLPDAVDPSPLPPGRARTHLEALKSLWASLGGALPEDLAAIRHVLSANADDALEPLPVLDLPDDPYASAAERALRARLIEHHGLAPSSAAATWLARRAALSGIGRTKGSLGHLQASLLGTVVKPIANDGSLAFFGLRDVAQEADFAAALAQAMLDEGRAREPAEIGLLIPDEPAYTLHLGRAFARVGIPLSGLGNALPERDVAGETLLHALQALRTPAPVMALASLYVSPLMPWPAEVGQMLARETMQGRFTPTFAKQFTGRAAALFQVLRNGAGSRETLRKGLEALASNLTEDEKWREQTFDLCLRIKKTIGQILANPDNGTPEWDALLRDAAPSAPASGAAERWVEGASIFSAAELPWRRAQHLIVLGFAGDRYPRPTSANPFFLDSELALIREATGLHMQSQADILAARLELFRRQLCCAEASTTFLSPYRAGDGKPLAPSTGLSLVARTIAGAKEPTQLVVDLATVAHASWPCKAHHARPLAHDGQPPIPESGTVALDRDLTELRLDRQGRPRAQSPSRLETLIVSPLAWVMGELDAVDVPWAPETFDMRIKGILAHDVFEFLFEEDAPLPALAAIPDAVGQLLDEAIRRHAPFLQATSWAVERATLEREIRDAARRWHGVLTAHQATVIKNEVTLAGTAQGIPVSGRADCILRLGDGRLLIIDHKKSGSNARRNRMEAGWDLQLHLYRAMLMQPQEGTSERLIELLDGATPGVAYHLMNDGGVLQNGLSFDPPSEHLESVANEISASAIARLEERLADVRAGVVRLNGEGDASFYAKTAMITPYALDASPLIAAFYIPSSGPEGDDE